MTTLPRITAAVRRASRQFVAMPVGDWQSHWAGRCQHDDYPNGQTWNKQDRISQGFSGAWQVK